MEPNSEDVLLADAPLTGLSPAASALRGMVQKREDSHDAGVEAPHILIIEDDVTLGGVLIELLHGEGFRTTLAHSLAAAEQLLLIETQPIGIDLILCDIVMPDGNGLEFHAQLRESRWSNLPFIFLTGQSDPELIRRGKEQGCDDYLIKPIQSEDLLSVVRGKVELAHRREDSIRKTLDIYCKRIIQTLSHEFRTPLVSITTGTELLLDEEHPVQQDSARQLLESIRRGGYRLQQLVEDFVALQQIQMGYSEQIWRTLSSESDLSTVCTRAAARFEEYYRDIHPASPLKIEFQAPSSQVPTVYLCSSQIDSCIERLLSNAVKFAGDTKPIRISLTTSPSQITIWVRDYGKGMNTERGEEACQPFTQLDRDKYEQQGCGLGLAITQYLVHLNGGHLLFVPPEDGVGLAVGVCFPVGSKRNISAR